MKSQIGLIIGSLALAHAAAFGQDGHVGKRGLLDDLFGGGGAGQNRNKEDGRGNDRGNDCAATTTETVRQTITVGGAGAGSFVNTTAPASTVTLTELASTVTVTAQATTLGSALDVAAADR
jgi:hypothetical protein